MAEVRLGAALETASARLSPSLATLLLMALLVVVAGRIVEALTELMQGGVAPIGVMVVAAAFAVLLALFVAAPLGAGFAFATLAAARGEKPEWSHLGIGWRRLGGVIGLNLLQGVLLLGLVVGPFVALVFALGDVARGDGQAVALATALIAVLFVVPLAVFLAVRWAFALLHLLDEGCGPVEALRRSWHASADASGAVFGLVLLFVAAAVAGAIFDAMGGALLGASFIVEIMAMLWLSTGLAVLYTLVGGGQGPRPRVPLPTRWEPILAEGVVYARPAGPP